MSFMQNRLYQQEPSSNGAPHDSVRIIQPPPTSSPSFSGEFHPQLPPLNTHSPYSPGPHNDYSLPTVGNHRCYWALLSADLQFIYLDPVLQFHLEEQAPSLIGKSLLQFVHPDEQGTAERDLGGVLQSRTLIGSVTRVRFSRLSRVRRELGHNGPPPSFPSAEKVIFDENYMAVDIVLNLAAEGLVLCFIHATADINPMSDNDKHVKSSWTNWCGTPVLGQEQIQTLSRSLLVCAPESSHGRVFQILSNTAGRSLLLSWPPAQPGFSEQDIAALAKSVDFDDERNTNPQAKTNCTRRYRAPRELYGGKVESVYIPHGSVIFACHKLQTSSSPSPSSAARNATTSSSTTSIPNAVLAPMGYNGTSTTTSYPLAPPHQSSYYDAQYSLPPLSSATTLPSSAPNSYPYVSSSQTHSTSTSPSYSSYSNTWASLPSHPTVQSLRSGSYWSHNSPSYETGSSNVPPPLNLSGGPPQPHDNYRPLSPFGHASYSPTTSSSTGVGLNADQMTDDHPSPASVSTTSTDLVPPPRRRVSPGTSREYLKAEGNGTVGGRERSHGNRPSGILKCSSCKATTSPEWRKGPSGKKELCNACGLRYARSRAKKEGHVPNSTARRRKDKIHKRDSATPPTPVSSTASSVAPPGSSYTPSANMSFHPSSTPPYASSGSLRRSYGSSFEDTSFSSAGSASGSDIYAPHRSTGTPSPSPPAGSGFAHYVSSENHSHGSHHSVSGRNSYYGSSIPSPLAANPPMLQSQSYERDHRDGSHGRDVLPHTPVSAESRRSYYEASTRDGREGTFSDYGRFDRSERKEGRSIYEREYEKEYEREARGRSLVSG